MRIARLMILTLACLAWANLPDAAQAQMMGGGMMPFGSPFGTLQFASVYCGVPAAAGLTGALRCCSYQSCAQIGYS